VSLHAVGPPEGGVERVREITTRQGRCPNAIRVCMTIALSFGTIGKQKGRRRRLWNTGNTSYEIPRSAAGSQ
jgi:hypothetical protein